MHPVPFRYFCGNEYVDSRFCHHCICHHRHHRNLLSTRSRRRGVRFRVNGHSSFRISHPCNGNTPVLGCSLYHRRRNTLSSWRQTQRKRLCRHRNFGRHPSGVSYKPDRSKPTCELPAEKKSTFIHGNSPILSAHAPCLP